MLDSRTFGLHLCSPDVSIFVSIFLYIRESHRGSTSVQDSFVSNSQSKKSTLFKNPMFSESCVSRAKAPPTERSEKAMGTRMG